MRFVLVVLFAGGIALAAQNREPAGRPTLIRAIGEAAVPVRAGTATLRLAVNTRGRNSERAGARNAEQSTKVINQLRDLLGANANIRTVDYALTNRRDGYFASNTIEVQVRDAVAEGKVIDIAAKLDARIVGDARPSEQDSASARAEALRLATVQARKNADAMAAGLGMHVVRVVSAEPEAAAAAVWTPPAGLSAEQTSFAKRLTLPTPVEVGTEEIRARVAVTVEAVP